MPTNIRQSPGGVILSVRVKAGSGAFLISPKHDFLEVRTRSPAEGNRANLEIVKELSGIFGSDVRIVRGLKSKRKEVLVRGISAEEAENILGK
jgi:uncharacterized protein (TIGR00251 family)